MNIPFTLNGKKTILDVAPEDTLLNVLRDLNLTSVKEGCTKGICGSCTVLLDNKPVHSCLIPSLLLKDTSIETLEHFMISENYKDIAAGFEKAGIHLCGFCNADKIFTAWDIIQRYEYPKKQDLYDEVSHITWCCTDRDTYINGIIYAMLQYKSRKGAIKNGRK
ncbi:MAG: 2Fe-2S iron-sulfur cluster binding domain-containing protein [Treponema sp.]|nr:2Fe-2S iron-sulfur cluster binding domain-containing protein [Treponema sp.]